MRRHRPDTTEAKISGDRDALLVWLRRENARAIVGDVPGVDDATLRIILDRVADAIEGKRYRDRG